MGTEHSLYRKFFCAFVPIPTLHSEHWGSLPLSNVLPVRNGSGTGRGPQRSRAHQMKEGPKPRGRTRPPQRMRPRASVRESASGSKSKTLTYVGTGRTRSQGRRRRRPGPVSRTTAGGGPSLQKPRPAPPVFWSSRGPASLAAAEAEPREAERRRRGTSGPLLRDPAFCADHDSHKAPRSGRARAEAGPGAGRARARGGAAGMWWGRWALRLTGSCGARGPVTLDSRRCRQQPQWVVARAAHGSPALRGPAGRGAGSGQHEPGDPAGRRGAGVGRGAAAGHPEPPPGRRRGPGELAMVGRPGGLWAAGDLTGVVQEAPASRRCAGRRHSG